MMPENSEEHRNRRGSARPIVIGLTCDSEPRESGSPGKTTGHIFLRRGYAEAVVCAGGLPIILTQERERIRDYVDICDGFIFTGGDDPNMEAFGLETHPKATRVDLKRQEFEAALLRVLYEARAKPILGICLGMQMMCLLRGGVLDQYLPEALATHDMHWGKKMHAIAGPIGSGEVLSHHKQAIVEAGEGMTIVGRASDGVIEAVEDAAFGRMCIGVQWHPERSGDGDLGIGLIRRLVEGARGTRNAGVEMERNSAVCNAGRNSDG